MKDPTEELIGIYFSLWSWDISLSLNMTERPLSALRATSPEGGSEVCFYCLCERSEAISREGGGLRSIFSVLFQGDCRGTSCLAMTTSRAMARWDISLALNMTVAVKLFFFFKLRYADHVRNGHGKRYSVSGGF